MRILILGTNYSALKFFELFQKNKNNDVFSMFSHSKNCIEFKLNQDILDFCTANEIDFVLSVQEEYATSYLTEELSENNITVFSPSYDAIEISSSKAAAYRLMHKNMISTPKFFVAEKLSTAIEFSKSTNLPIAIKPDNHSFQEGTKFCQTQNEVIETCEKLFSTGNKKIILQDYIEGKNIMVWTISDGYRAKIINMVLKYQNNIAYLKPNILSCELENEIKENIINPTINALVEEDREYVGVLGFDIILDKNNTPFLVGYNSFFDDICVDFFTKNKNYNWEEIFNSTIIGNIFLKSENILPQNEEYMLAIRENEKINFIRAKTKTNLDRIIKEMNYNTKELDEAKVLWKM